MFGSICENKFSSRMNDISKKLDKRVKSFEQASVMNIDVNNADVIIKKGKVKVNGQYISDTEKFQRITLEGNAKSIVCDKSIRVEGSVGNVESHNGNIKVDKVLFNGNILTKNGNIICGTATECKMETKNGSIEVVNERVKNTVPEVYRKRVEDHFLLGESEVFEYHPSYKDPKLMVRGMNFDWNNCFYDIKHIKKINTQKEEYAIIKPNE